MVSGNFLDLLTILSDREKEPDPREFFLDYNIIKNRGGAYCIMKIDKSVFYMLPMWLIDIIYEFKKQGRNEIIKEIKDTLEIK